MSESDSDSSLANADAAYWVKPDQLPTIKQLYDNGTLKKPISPAAGSDADKNTTEAAGGSVATTAANVGANPKAYPPKAGLLERVSLYKGNITRIQVDAIVNAANKSLLGGGGVDGAIHSAAGPKLLTECRQLNGARTGESKITKGYNLPARHVIHTVGPVYDSSEVEEKARLLESCYKTSLEVAVENRLKHIAFPSVSTGIYGYPIEDATHVALRTAREFLERSEADKLEKIIFVVFLDKDEIAYRTLIPQYFPPVETEGL